MTAGPNGIGAGFAIIQLVAIFIFREGGIGTLQGRHAYAVGNGSPIGCPACLHKPGAAPEGKVGEATSGDKGGDVKGGSEGGLHYHAPAYVTDDSEAGLPVAENGSTVVVIPEDGLEGGDKGAPVPGA